MALNAAVETTKSFGGLVVFGSSAGIFVPW
jgi:hypothetical protein